MFKKNKYILFSLSLFFLSACADIDGMSDEAEITAFHITSHTPSTVQLETPIISGKVITIPVKGSLQQFPLSFTASFTTEGYIADMLGDNPANMVFEHPVLQKHISLITESGVPVTYTIKLQLEKVIQHFTIKKSNQLTAALPHRAIIDHLHAQIILPLAQIKFPLSIDADIEVDSGVRFENYESGATLDFLSAEDSILITTVNNEGLLIDWKVKLDVNPQLPNSGFNEWYHAWSTPNDTKEQIGRSAEDMYWCTTNDPLSGFEATKIIGESGLPNDYAVQLRTNIKNVLSIRKLGSAGLFIGFFNINIAYLNEPVRMTKMGRPFLLRPTKVGFSGKYMPGNTYYIEDENGRPVEAPGSDKGSCRVRIEHWTNDKGDVLYDYVPVTSEEYEAIHRKIVGTGEYLISTTSNWTYIEVPVIYDSPMPVTHISVDFASSQDGARFCGADGSVLSVDNFKLMYD